LFNLDRQNRKHKILVQKFASHYYWQNAHLPKPKCSHFQKKNQTRQFASTIVSSVANISFLFSCSIKQIFPQQKTSQSLRVFFSGLYSQKFFRHHQFVPNYFVRENFVRENFVRENFVRENFVRENFVRENFVRENFVPKNFVPKNRAPKDQFIS
jgi:hypothetical protein